MLLHLPRRGEVTLLRSREVMLLRSHEVPLPDISTRLLRDETPLRRRLHCPRCIVPVPSAAAPREVTAPIFEPWRGLHVRAAYRRRPHPSIHHHFMAPPVEAVISADPMEAAAEPDRSTHEEARTRPREDDIGVVDRHVHQATHRLDINVPAVIRHLHLRTALQISILLCFPPQVLDGIHHCALILHHCLIKSLNPARVRSHHLQHARILHQRLDRRIKGSARTLGGRGNLIRISGRGKDLCQQRIRIERDPGNQVVELSAPARCSSRRYRNPGQAPAQCSLAVRQQVPVPHPSI